MIQAQVSLYQYMQKVDYLVHAIPDTVIEVGTSHPDDLPISGTAAIHTIVYYSML